MTRNGLRTGSAGVMLMTCATATAQILPANRSDGRCLAAMSLTGEQVAGGEKAAFETGMMFFLGKIVGRSGTAAVNAALEAGSTGLTEANAPAIAETCAGQMETASAAM